MIKINDNRLLVKPKNRIKEIEDGEIEDKMQYLGKDIEKEFKKLRKVFTENLMFEIIPDLDNLEWLFYFDYFGYKINGTLKRSFVVIHHASTNNYWLRYKGDYVGLKRTEKTISLEGKYSETKIGEYIRNEEKRLGTKVYKIGRLKRNKKYFFIKNRLTSRTYTISLDLCRFRKKTMSQLEVEYKWIVNEAVGAVDTVSQIEADMVEISRYIREHDRDKLFVPTKYTKWEWIVSLMDSIEIGIISDTHIYTDKTALPWSLIAALKGVDLIIHAGDISFPGVIRDLQKIAPVKAVMGNKVDDQSNFEGKLPEFINLNFFNVRIHVEHGHVCSESKLDMLIGAGETNIFGKGLRAIKRILKFMGIKEFVNMGIVNRLRSKYQLKCDCVIFGHTHKVMIKKIDGVLLVNPGDCQYDKKKRGAIVRLTIGKSGKLTTKIVKLDFTYDESR